MNQDSEVPVVSNDHYVFNEKTHGWSRLSAERQTLLTELGKKVDEHFRIGFTGMPESSELTYNQRMDKIIAHARSTARKAFAFG